MRKARAIGGEGANAALILNPRLADIGFQRLVDPYTCFQAISQFIEGVVPGQQMPMMAISDASQVRKKGFDPKYGFRKRPAGHDKQPAGCWSTPGGKVGNNRSTLKF